MVHPTLQPTQISEYLAIGSGLNFSLGYILKNNLGFDIGYSGVSPEFNKNLNSIIKSNEELRFGLSRYFLENNLKISSTYSRINDQNEKPFLDNILENAYKKGLRFITDSDARSSSGSHVNAHLWDNGKNVTQNLNEIFKIREKAISNFSEYNIKKGEPFSKLEDLFVPLYFMHRYQTEAVIKLIGGMDYNYSTRGP